MVMELVVIFCVLGAVSGVAACCAHLCAAHLCPQILKTPTAAISMQLKSRVAQEVQYLSTLLVFLGKQ